MLKRLFPFVWLVTLTGCPYTEGCQGLPEEPLADPNGAPTEEGERTPFKSEIDFGGEPTGGPMASTLSCPELAMPKAAATIFVDAKAGDDGDGTKESPFSTLAEAFEHAEPHAVIWVALGTYRENLAIPDKDLVVFGGFTSEFTSRTNACGTILEGAKASDAVLSAGADVRSFELEGVTVRKGARGLHVSGDSTTDANFTVARCVFTENGKKTEVGGAVALESVNARIFRSVFKNNRASKGAAIAGAGDKTLIIDQNLVEKNLGYSDHGGGVYLSARSSKISRNTFRGNATGVDMPAGFGGSWGGALIVYSNDVEHRAKAELSFNVFTENLAGIGGAVFVDEGAVLTMSHDLLYRNRAYKENGFIHGAAIYVDGTGEAGGGSSLTGEFLTVVNNVYDEKGVAQTSSYGGNVYIEGFSKASFTNSIFWNNGERGFYVEAGKNELTVDNSIGESECTSSNGEGFIKADRTICKLGTGVFEPAAIYFGDEAADDYHEKSKAGRFAKGRWLIDTVTSPAIDKADPKTTAGTEPTPNGNRANLGVFARTSEASKSP